MRTVVGLAAVFAIFTVFVLSLHMSPLHCEDLEQPLATPAALTRLPPTFRPLPAPCRANTSMEKLQNFTEQPQHVRNFLLHRHCRDFPLLQDVPPDKCAQPAFLLLVIKSSPSNYERRELVRRTWGRERKVRGVQLRRLFLVGTASHPLEAPKVNRLLAMEAQVHGDILQWDFHDTFTTSTRSPTQTPAPLGGPATRPHRTQGLVSAVSPCPGPAAEPFICTGRSTRTASPQSPPTCSTGWST